MKTKPRSEIEADELRRRAEQMAQWLLTHPLQGEVDAQRLLHELQVYQVELEMQNAELRHARAETEAALNQANLLNEQLSQREQGDTDSRETGGAAPQTKSGIRVDEREDMRASLKIIAEMSHQIRRSGVSAVQAQHLDKIDAASQHLLETIKVPTDQP